MNTQEWKEKVEGVRKDQEVEFKITITNTGTEMIDELRVVDVLPANLTLTSDASSWKVLNFAPGASYTLTLTAKANVINITEGTSKCVDNIAQIKIDGKVKAEDDAVVCIKAPGDVHGDVKKLPDTGTSTLEQINHYFGLIAVFLLLGAIFYNTQLILVESNRR